MHGYSCKVVEAVKEACWLCRRVPPFACKEAPGFLVGTEKWLKVQTLCLLPVRGCSVAWPLEEELCGLPAIYAYKLVVVVVCEAAVVCVTLQ